MENTAFRQLKEALDKAKNIGIVVGRQPSLDEMGAALALYLSLSAMGKPTVIASADEPIVELSSLVGINKVRPNLSSESGDLTVSFPYKEGEIEKVSYTLEGGFLNIVVKAGEEGLSFTEKDIRYSKSQGGPDLLFVVGTPKLSDLGNLFNPQDLKDTTLVNLDNKVDNQGFGDIVLVSPRLSSVSEIAANVIFGLGLKADKDIAQNLMIGITHATDDFKDPRTSYLAFEIVSVLLRSGATRLSVPKTEPQRRYIHGQDFEEQLKQRIQEQRDLQGTNETPFTKAKTEEPTMPKPQPQGEQVREDQPAFAKALEGLREERRKAEQARRQQEQPQEQKKEEKEDAPDDWLTPKIYKGSTNF